MRQNFNRKTFPENKRYINQRLPSNLMKNSPRNNNVNQVSCTQNDPVDLNCQSLQESSEQTILL